MSSGIEFPAQDDGVGNKDASRRAASNLGTVQRLCCEFVCTVEGRYKVVDDCIYTGNGIISSHANVCKQHSRRYSRELNSRKLSLPQEHE